MQRKSQILAKFINMCNQFSQEPMEKTEDMNIREIEKVMSSKKAFIDLFDWRVSKYSVLREDTTVRSLRLLLGASYEDSKVQRKCCGRRAFLGSPIAPNSR